MQAMLSSDLRWARGVNAIERTEHIARQCVLSPVKTQSPRVGMQQRRCNCHLTLRPPAACAQLHQISPGDVRKSRAPGPDLALHPPLHLPLVRRHRAAALGVLTRCDARDVSRLLGQGLADLQPGQDDGVAVDALDPALRGHTHSQSQSTSHTHNRSQRHRASP